MAARSTSLAGASRQLGRARSSTHQRPGEARNSISLPICPVSPPGQAARSCAFAREARPFSCGRYGGAAVSFAGAPGSPHGYSMLLTDGSSIVNASAQGYGGAAALFDGSVHVTNGSTILNCSTLGMGGAAVPHSNWDSQRCLFAVPLLQTDYARLRRVKALPRYTLAQSHSPTAVPSQTHAPL